MEILAIDPGNKESGWCILADYKPVLFGKTTNYTLLKVMRDYAGDYDDVVIEMVASYGMPVGETVFDTCRWIGRFEQTAAEATVTFPKVRTHDVYFVKRKEYVTELCGSSRAKDANVIQYLIDRFAKDTPNRGKGTKKDKGWFYGFKADIWQAYAIGVYYIDRCKNGERN